MVNGQNMTNENLEKILFEAGDGLTGVPGNWQFEIGDVPMFCITDEMHNRMRIICPVRKMKEVTNDEFRKCMEANFHSVLDVRYASSRGVLWAAFIHPLRSLGEEQLLDAINQLYNAALTFGTTYNSTNLSFPKSREELSKNKTKKT
jgi:hypothetical protein